MTQPAATGTVGIVIRSGLPKPFLFLAAVSARRESQRRIHPESYIIGDLSTRMHGLHPCLHRRVLLSSGLIYRAPKGPKPGRRSSSAALHCAAAKH
jgi:hypothetical protein